MKKVGEMVQTYMKIISDIDKRYIPENTQGWVKSIYPVCVEIDFGIYGVWFISQKSIENGVLGDP